MEKEGAVGDRTPLIGRPTKSSTARYVAIISALGACVLTALVLNSHHTDQSSMAQTGVKYYYVPKAAVKNNKLPLHLMVCSIQKKFERSYLELTQNETK